MSFQQIDLRHVIHCHIADGACDLSFGVISCHLVGISLITQFHLIKIIIVNIFTALSALHDQGAGAHRIVRILLRKRRIGSKIHILHADMF